MDVKSAFLNGIIEEEVYIEQPTSYVKKGQKNKVYRLKKGLDVTKDPKLRTRDQTVSVFGSELSF